MKRLKLLVIAALMFQIYSCSCDKKITCGSLSNESLGWLNQNVNDTIAFKNAIGNQIKFIVTNRTVSPEYEETCFYNGLSCQCDDCEANGRLYALGDTMINGENSYSISIEEAGTIRLKLSSAYNVRMLDFFGKYYISNSSYNSTTIDSLLPTLQLGNITYSDVHTQTIDTTINYYKNNIVWKIYFTKSLGVIGFKERYFHSTFYR